MVTCTKIQILQVLKYKFKSSTYFTVKPISFLVGRQYVECEIEILNFLDPSDQNVEVAYTELEKTTRGIGFGNRNQETIFGFIKTRIPVRHLHGDVKSAARKMRKILYTSA